MVTSGAYADLDGVRTYYEIAGSGQPLLLLHGGAQTLESLKRQVPAFVDPAP